MDCVHFVIICNIINFHSTRDKQKCRRQRNTHHLECQNSKSKTENGQSSRRASDKKSKVTDYLISKSITVCIVQWKITMNKMVLQWNSVQIHICAYSMKRKFFALPQSNQRTQDCAWGNSCFLFCTFDLISHSQPVASSKHSYWMTLDSETFKIRHGWKGVSRSFSWNGGSGVVSAQDFLFNAIKEYSKKKPQIWINFFLVLKSYSLLFRCISFVLTFVLINIHSLIPRNQRTKKNQHKILSVTQFIPFLSFYLFIHILVLVSTFIHFIPVAYD